MRILQVTASLEIGGLETMVADLARELSDRGHSVIIVVTNRVGKIGENIRKSGQDIRLISDPNRALSRYLSSGKLLDIIRYEKIDIVHSHGTAGLVASASSKACGSSAQHIHTYHFGNYPDLKFKDRLLERLAWRAPDRLVAVGARQKTAICSTYGIPSERLRVVHNGVKPPNELMAADAVSELKDSGLPLIGTVATLMPQKGLDDLIHTALLLKQQSIPFRLAIAGDGRLKEDLKRQIENLDLSREVRILGWVQNAGATFIPFLDVFVQSSRWEAMSIVILEAMAAGIPIVATDVGDNSVVLTDNKNGYVVPPSEPGKLANRLAYLLMNKKLAKEMGRRAQREFLTKYTVDAMTDQYEKLYAEPS